jgi:hypothetical protein
VKQQRKPDEAERRRRGDFNNHNQQEYSMENRDFFRLSYIFSTLILCAVAHGADSKKNADTLIKESNGNWVGQIPGGSGTTTIAPLPDMPKGPQISPQAPSSSAPSTQQPSNTAGGLLGLVIDAGKPSKAEQAKYAAEKAAEKAAWARTQDPGLVLGGTNVQAQFFPDPNNPVYGYPAPSPAQMAQMAEQAAKYPNLFVTPNVAAPVAQQVANTLSIAAPKTLGIPMPPAAQEAAKNLADHMIKNGAHLPKFGANMDMLNKSAQMAKAASDLADATSKAPDLLQGAGAVAGTAAAAKTGFFGSLAASAKAGAAYAAASAKAAGATVWAFGQAHPYVVGGTIIIGGGALAYKYLRGPGVGKVIVEEIMQPTPPQSHPEPKPHTEPVTKAAQPIRKKQSDLPHPNPTPNPLELKVEPFFPETEAQLKHIFRDITGHFKQKTDGAVKSIVDCIKKGKYHGQDALGNHKYSYVEPHTGDQVYAFVRDNGLIQNAGINLKGSHWKIGSHGFLESPANAPARKAGEGILRTVIGAGGATAAGLSNSSASAQSLSDTLSSSYGNMQLPQYDTLCIPDPPKDWTPERMQKHRRKTLAKVDEFVDQYMETEVYGQPYSPEVLDATKTRAKNDLIKHLNDTDSL